jgi:hypothetical protein
MINTKSLTFIFMRRQLMAGKSVNVATTVVDIGEYVAAFKNYGIIVKHEYIGSGTYELFPIELPNPNWSVATEAASSTTADTQKKPK